MAAARIERKRDRVRTIVQQALRRMRNARLAKVLGSWRRAVAAIEVAEAESARQRERLRMTFIWTTRRLTNARVTTPSRAFREGFSLSQYR